jgi:hypothetical protein
MKIEVYLKHIFQEYPTIESISINIGNDNWKKYERNCGCRGNVAMPPIDIWRDDFQRVFLRPETFGGLLYDPTSAVIYKLDQEAYRLIELLKKDENRVLMLKDPRRVIEFAKRNNFNDKDVKEMINQLQEYNLW